mmetsp:Transcript_19843/g.32609  ORF Transcript_19843/g.32609 Transcript_19843/m.32609 type:complete len:488 (+) Transcript_19843:395-1858(+)
MGELGIEGNKGYVSRSPKLQPISKTRYGVVLSTILGILIIINAFIKSQEDVVSPMRWIGLKMVFENKSSAGVVILNRTREAKDTAEVAGIKSQNSFGTEIKNGAIENHGFAGAVNKNGILEGNLLTECNGTFSENISDDPCYNSRPFSQASKLCGCRRAKNGSLRSTPFTYEIPPVHNSAKNLTQKELENEVLYTYIHVNKAGGQTIKATIFEAIADAGWDGAGYGTFGGWGNLRFPNVSASGDGRIHRSLLSAGVPRNTRSHTQSQFYECGRQVENGLDYHPNCSLRAVWGALSMGLCDHFPEKPCIYFMNIREPISRAISEYNYFCIRGAEHRKKWLPAWKRAGRCPLNIIEYFEQGFGSKTALVDRLTRGCDDGCGIQVAKHNLRHPCLRYLMLDSLMEDVKELSRLFLGGPMFRALKALSASNGHRNQNKKSKTVVEQIGQPGTIERLTQILAVDIEIYNYAKSLKKEKWKQELVSCNAHHTP